MKKVINSLSIAALILSFSTLLSGCSVIEGIFKAGVWVGILLVVVVIAIILFLVGKSK
jgi:hypothetical protein